MSHEIISDCSCPLKVNCGIMTLLPPQPCSSLPTLVLVLFDSEWTHNLAVISALWEGDTSDEKHMNDY